MLLADARNVACGRGWLSRQSRPLQTALLSHALLRHYARNTPIYHEGEEAAEIFCIVSGVVAMSVAHPVVGELVAHVMHAGDWFGEPATLGRRPRFAATEARTEVAVLVVPRAVINDLAQSSLDYTYAFFNLLSDNSETYMLNAVDLLISDARRRVISRLLTLAGRRLDRLPPAPGRIPISHEELALTCALSRARVQDILAGLQAEGLCELSYREVRLPDPAALVACLSS